MHFFNPRTSYRVSGSSSPSKTIGQNPPNGAVFHYYLKDKPNEKDKFSLEILYKNKIIRTISNKKGGKAKVFDDDGYEEGKSKDREMMAKKPTGTVKDNFGKGGVLYKGKAKDSPGMSNIIKRNKLKVVPININKKK